MNAAPLRPSVRPRRLLSRGEARVLAFTAAGYTRDQVAELLGIGPETVKSQRASILKKLKARNITHAVAIAFARGLASPELIERVDEYIADREKRPSQVATTGSK